MHLESSLNVIDSVRNLWRVYLNSIRDTETKATQVPLPSVPAATEPRTTRKRPAISPPMKERIEKYPNECSLFISIVDREGYAKILFKKTKIRS